MEKQQTRSIPSFPTEDLKVLPDALTPCRHTMIREALKAGHAGRLRIELGRRDVEMYRYSVVDKLE